MINNFLTDARYTTLRHALFAGAAVYAAYVLQAVTATDFGAYTPLIVAAAACILRILAPASK
jgi:uncharacterized membrane protein